MKRASKSFIFLSLCCFLIAGCVSNSTKNNGSVATDDDIRAMFEIYEYDLTYNYFYSLGRWNRSPVAIVGINKDYVLVKESYPSDFTNWQQFEPSSEKLKELIEALEHPTSTYTSSVGFIIYAPGGGDEIGIMYSAKWNADMPEIRFKDGSLIVVKPVTFNLSGPSGAP